MSRSPRKPKRPAQVPEVMSDVEEAILKEGQRRVTVRGEDGAQDLPVIELIARSLSNSAAKGSPQALHAWMKMHQLAFGKKQARIDNEIAVAQRYQDHAYAEMAEAEEKGLPQPTPLPHPDDLRMDHQVGVWIDGPETPAQVDVYNWIKDIRTQCMRQHALDKKNGLLGKGLGAAFKLAELSNQALPERMQLSGSDMFDLAYGFDGQTKRQLLKDTYREWQRLGFDARRGETSITEEELDRLMPHIAQITTELIHSQGKTSDIKYAIKQIYAATRRVRMIG